MKKIIRCLAIVVLSVAGFSSVAKETSTTSQITLANVEAKTTALAKVVEKTEEIKVSTLEKIEKQLADLDAQKNERTKIEIERDRKSIEFWFAALAIITSLVAILGALLPFLMGRKDKERLQSELEEARRLVASINDKHNEAEKSLKSMQGFTSGNESKPIETTAIQAEIKSVNENPDRYSEVDKLRARAVQASLIENPTEKQALQAYELWKGLSIIKTDDASAQFNVGYWAQELAEKNAKPGTQYWSQQAQVNYESTLKNNPDKHEAAYNWGNALGDEAAELAKTDLKAAQVVWAKAGEKYALALSIKADMHEAANNWGFALDKEAAELAKTDLKAAQTNWRKAVKILQKQAELTTSGGVSYNLACFLSRLEQFKNSLDELEIARQNNQLPSHWQEDEDLINLRKTDEYKTWYKTHFGDDKT